MNAYLEIAKSGESAIVISQTRAEVRAVNDAIREQLRDRGLQRGQIIALHGSKEPAVSCFFPPLLNYKFPGVVLNRGIANLNSKWEKSMKTGRSSLGVGCREREVTSRRITSREDASPQEVWRQGTALAVPQTGPQKAASAAGVVLSAEC